MRKVESLAIKYVGHKEPQTNEEVELEVLGLLTAIAAAKQRIAVLKQGVMLQHVMNASVEKETTDEKTVEKTSEPDKAEQESVAG